MPWFDGRASFRDEWPDIAGRVRRVFDNDRFAHGELTLELEEAVGRYTGARYAVGVSSGADALHLALRAAGVGEGDEVVVPAFGPRSSVAAVLRTRATPVFADVDAVSGTLAPDAVAARLSERTKAVVPVHVFARPVDVVALRRITDEAGVAVVEDTMQAMGARAEGVHSGLGGAAGALSFAPWNTLGALGDAGMVITDDAELARRCLLLRHHGRTGEVPGRPSEVSGSAAVVGVNSKMDEIQAAVLLTRLASLDHAIARRRAVAARYTGRLAGLPGVDVPLTTDDQVWPTYVLEVDRRDALADHLARAGVQTAIPCPVPLHLLTGGSPGTYPAAEAASARTLALPVHPDLATADVDHVCAAVALFCEGGRG
ncbi:DegT/DnrJ/EryC1/StrS family aminotransferase [Umezawaea tangerina]|uniref:DegT/DnrJ/EryC1/StrS family aminotransferase n=1 Tax=Umezawaea tangerina TaxID=84725 RepID=UPI0014730BC3|nr:DegT/DnrJ/EryC1/StrS family aminotransferase [Umezawaea tangerina]